MKLAERAKGLFLSRHWLTLSVFFFAASAMVCWSIWITFAANRTWTGGTPGDPACSSPNPLWTNPCNWTSKVLPVAGDDLIFGSSLQANSTNSFANGTTFNSISISAGHLMTGNSVSLNSGITANNGQISLSSIKLNANQTFSAPNAGTGGVITSVVDNNAKTLTVDGPGNFTMTGLIAGTGGLVKSGAGTLILVGSNTYTGTTTVNAGTVLVFGSQPQSNIVLSPAFGTSAILGGSGAVGVISDSGLGFANISPGAANNGTGILTANGNVVFSPIAQDTFEVDLKGATVGSGYDQIKVNGTLVLNNVLSPLTVNLGFTPAPGTTFIIADNDGVDPVSGTFAGHAEGSIFTVNGTLFGITYKGGDGNDVVLHVPETKTWIGGGADNKWTTGANWVGGNAPQVGDSLVFPASAVRLSNVNDLPPGTVFSQITISSSSYQLTGNDLSLISGLTDLSGNGSNSIIGFTTIKLIGDQTFTKTNSIFMNISSAIDTNGKTLTLDGSAQKNFDGTITGSGGLVINGSGDVQFRGTPSNPHTYSGNTIVNSGSFTILHDVTNSGVQLNGGLIHGNHIVKSIAGTGGTLQLENDFGAPLGVNADLTLNSAVNVAVELSTSVGAPASSGINVSGAVNLGNATLTPIATFASTPAAGTSLVVINKTSAGPVQGTFSGRPEGALLTISGSVFRLTYVGGDGNDVFLIAPATRTWDGGGTTSAWTEAANWVGDVAPSPGDSIVFPSGAARLANSNNFPAGTTFNSITFSAPGYSLGGNLVGLIAGITRIDSVASGDVVNLPIRLDGFQTFSTPANTNLFVGSIDTNGQTLAISGGGRWNLGGTITGTGGLTFNGLGLTQVTSPSPNTFSGPTMINSGQVQLIAAQPNSPLVINGGQVFGGAAVKSIFGTGGTIHPQFPGAMSSIGNVNLNSGVIFDTAISRDVSSATSVTFSVGGDVNLGNCALTINANFQVPPAFTDTFKIVDKTSGGPIQGIFNNLPEGATLMLRGYPFRITYVGGDGNDVALALLPPIIFVEQGTSNRAVTVDSVTLVRDPLPLNTDHNFSADHRTRVILLTSSLGLNQPDPSVLTVQAAGFNLTVEGVGPITGVAGLDGSYIVARLPEGLPTGDLPIALTLRGVTSNTAILRISP